MATQLREIRINRDTSIPIRTEARDGREYMVVPVVTLVEGVVRGATSPAPELALRSEFGADPGAWNGIPVTIGHPVVNGSMVSVTTGTPLSTQVDDEARATVLSRDVTGVLESAELDGDRMRAEAWIDLAKANEIGTRATDLLAHIENGDAIEISSGYFADAEKRAGIWDFKPFAGIQRNVRPDHMALLPFGQEGACNWQSGCGVRANCSGDCSGVVVAEPQVNEVETIRWSRVAHSDGEYATGTGNTHLVNSCCGDAFPVVNPHTGKLNRDAVMNVLVTWPENVSPDTLAKARDCATGILKRRFDVDIDTQKISALQSHGDLNAALSIALEDWTGDAFIFVRDVFDDRVIYSKNLGGDLIEQGFTVDGAGSVTLSGDEHRVRQVTDFVAAMRQEGNMDIKETVTSLIANEATRFSEDQREWLESLSAEQLEVLAPQSAKPPDTGAGAEPEIRANTEPITTEQYIAAAPPDLREVLASGLRLHEANRKDLIDSITSNDRSVFTAEELAGKGIEELGKLAALAAPKTDYFRPGPQSDQSYPTPPPLFSAGQ